MQAMSSRTFIVAVMLTGAAIAQSQPSQPPAQTNTSASSPSPSSTASSISTTQWPQTQSLGDLARTQREKEQAQAASGVKPMVITNHDLPEPTPGVPLSSPSDPMTTVSGVSRASSVQSPFANQHAGNHGFANGGSPDSVRPSAGQPSAPYSQQRYGNGMRGGQGMGQGQSRAQIEEQENRVAEMQARIDRMNANMQRSTGTVTYSGPANRQQSMQGERLEMMQERLNEQKRRLEMMQDSARRSGANQ
jgi:hypothetical protein